jgi:hypothetical protein
MYKAVYNLDRWVQFSLLQDGSGPAPQSPLPPPGVPSLSLKGWVFGDPGQKRPRLNRCRWVRLDPWVHVA